MIDGKCLDLIGRPEGEGRSEEPNGLATLGGEKAGVAGEESAGAVVRKGKGKAREVDEHEHETEPVPLPPLINPIRARSRPRAGAAGGSNSTFPSQALPGLSLLYPPLPI